RRRRGVARARWSWWFHSVPRAATAAGANRRGRAVRRPWRARYRAGDAVHRSVTPSAVDSRLPRMVQIGYAAALEQLPPLDALDAAVRAEQHGFTGVMASDVLAPWVPAQGQAPFVWNVLTALAERTRGDIGPGVAVPTFRWHAAVLAQASATWAAMYPGRHWLGIGSGEAINEHAVARYWPEAPERINRMFEAIEIISKLFAGSAAG